MHLRPPSVDHGVQSFLWAVFFGLFVWLGLLAIATSAATAFIFGALAGAAIFLFVRRFGQPERRQAESSRTRIR